MKKNSTYRSKILFCTLFCVTFCAALTAFATTQHNSAHALEGMTQYERGGFVKYSNYETAWMTFDGIHGTCATPWKIAPPTGSYHYTSEFENLPNAYGVVHPKWLLANYLYYGYGGPGFSKSDPAWPKTNRFGQPMSDEDYMVATHILVSDAYTCNGAKSLYGISGDAYRWFAWDILGYGEAVGVDHENPNAAGSIFRKRPHTLDKITPIAIMPGGKWQTCISYKKNSCNVELVKEDAASGKTPQRGLTLDGAIFEAIDELGNRYTATTKTINGQTRFTFTEIPFGKLTIRETQAPEGYLPSQSTIEIDLHDQKPNQDNVISISTPVKETVKAFDIQIAKFLGDYHVDSGLKTPGAEISFEVISNTTQEVIATLTTDKDGFVDTSTEEAWYGLGDKPQDCAGSFPYDPAGYTIHEVETSTPDGYKPSPDWTISANEQINGVCLKYIVDNGPAVSRIQFIKVDSSSNLPITKAGFTFELYNEQKELITQENWYPNHCTLSQFTTDDSGCVTLPEQLIDGTYFVKEVAAPAPYVVDDEFREFVVSSQESSTSTTAIPISNTSARGQLNVVKVDAQTQEKITGAAFELLAAEDIISADGRVLATKNELLASSKTDNYQTTEEGITLLDLPLNSNGEGHYLLKETQAPSGFLLPDKPLELSIIASDNSDPIVIETLTIENKPNEFVIQKVSDHDPAIKLPGATFILWDVDDELIDENAQNEADEQTQQKAIDTQQAPLVLHPDQVIIDTTDKNGEIHLSHLSPGTYKWVEIKAPEGYVLTNPPIHSFSVDTTGCVLVEDKESNAPIVVEKNIPTHITIEKRDDISEKFVEGATLSLWHANDEGNPIGDPIKTWKTTETGTDFYGLVCGTYVVTEDEAPTGYQQLDKVVFDITPTADTQSIVVYNHSLEPKAPEDKSTQPSHKMPQTGSPLWPQWMGNISLIASCGLFLALLISLAHKSRK